MVASVPIPPEQDHWNMISPYLEVLKIQLKEDIFLETPRVKS